MGILSHYKSTTVARIPFRQPDRSRLKMRCVAVIVPAGKQCRKTAAAGSDTCGRCHFASIQERCFSDTAGGGLLCTAHAKEEREREGNSSRGTSRAASRTPDPARVAPSPVARQRRLSRKESETPDAPALSAPEVAASPRAHAAAAPVASSAPAAETVSSPPVTAETHKEPSRIPFIAAIVLVALILFSLVRGVQTAASAPGGADHEYGGNPA